MMPKSNKNGRMNKAVEPGSTKFDCPVCGFPAPVFASNMKFHETIYSCRCNDELCAYEFKMKVHKMDGKVEFWGAMHRGDQGETEEKWDKVLNFYFALWNPKNEEKYKSKESRRIWLAVYRSAAEKATGITLNPSDLENLDIVPRSPDFTLPENLDELKLEEED